MADELAVAVSVPPQVLDVFGVEATVTFAGNAMESATPESAEVLAFVSVKYRLVVPLTSIVAVADPAGVLPSLATEVGAEVAPAGVHDKTLKVAVKLLPGVKET